MTRVRTGGRSLSELATLLFERGVAVDFRGGGEGVPAGVSDDSRMVEPGDLFLAWKGEEHDGHDFVAEAVRRGAVGVMVERFLDIEIPQLRVPEGRLGAAFAASLLFDEPGRSLRIAAVTGTNGKTTTSLLARHLLGSLTPTAALGTLGLVGPDGVPRPGTGGLTTPGAIQIAETLRSLADEGVTTVALEASSHALHQSRLDALEIEVAAFTNLTRDHLDYHRTFVAYWEAKARLLNLVREGGGVVVNGADPAWAELPTVRSRLVVCYIDDDEVVGAPACSGERLPDLVAQSLEVTGEGSRFRVRWGGADAPVFLPLLGRFNVENALSALGISLLMGIDLAEAADLLASSPQVMGRLEITVREPVPVVLDYAHTPDALRRVLETLRPLYPGRLILVFGAGGGSRSDEATRDGTGRGAWSRSLDCHLR
jgi:UDP-N-acetylmuramoyl-L-alanyl-D-glutamate--2,6-diaminopimelate ligase